MTYPEYRQSIRRCAVYGLRAMLAAALLALVVLGNCACSPTQTAWVERGLAGIELAKGNQTAWYEAAVAQLDKDRRHSIAVVFAETRLVMARGVATSGPATRPVDADWITAQEKALLVTMSMYDVKKADLDAKYQIAMRNLDSTGEAFVQVQRLNRAWAGSGDALAAEVARLSAAIANMQRSR